MPNAFIPSRREPIDRLAELLAHSLTPLLPLFYARLGPYAVENTGPLPFDAEPPLVQSAPASYVTPQSVARQSKSGRNDPCPCGSGKKHKKCCGKG
jgi:SEC-C motif